MSKPSYTLFVLLLISMVTFSNCKKDDPTPADQVQSKITEISGSYSINTVTLDNTDVTSEYTGMVITLTASKTYQTGPGDYDPVWPDTGPYVFKDETSNPPVLTSFIRDDDVEVSYVLNGSSMTFSFNIPNPLGRTTGADGDYVFSCTKQ